MIGGGFNLAIKAYQGKITNFKDGLVAFGIGAVAGVTGSIVASPIQGTGNNLYFGDPYSLKAFGRDLLFGAIGGGVVGGATAYFKGNNVWYGNAITKGRTAFSFNNMDKYAYKIEIGKPEVISFNEISDVDQVDVILNKAYIMVILMFLIVVI